MDNVNDRQNSVPMAILNTGTNGENGFNLHTDNNDNIAFQNLAKHDPIDLQFKGITYTVDLGFRKGKPKEKCFFCFTSS